MTYSIGIDYGTDSGRVLVVDTTTGDVIGKHIVAYKHGVIEGVLGDRLIPSTFSLQDSRDYLDVLTIGIPKAITDAGIDASEIIGIGVNFTASTMIVCDADFVPLHWSSQFAYDPHAYVKLWKHHGAAKEARDLFHAAEADLERHLGNYGWNVSSEWMIPKLLELKNQAPHILDAGSRIMEAGDWVTSLLVGKNVRSECARGFKAFWNEKDGFNEDLFHAVDDQLLAIIHEKLTGTSIKVGEIAGRLSQEGSYLTGLSEDIAVAPAMIDAHAAVLGIGAVHNHELTMVMGTSTCHLMMHEEQKAIPGISGSVKDGVISGLYAYEAGQSAVGDLFATVSENVPASYIDEANQSGQSIHTLLEEKAALKKSGETGLVALDWHNGNRSPLSNSELTGMVIGLTLHTRVEDIYRAYMEATAFGTKMILNGYEKYGLPVKNVFACGGLPQKNNLLMQIYANVLNRPIHIVNTDYASAIGAAMLGAVAGGAYDTVSDAVAKMKQPLLKSVKPDLEDVAIYKELFSIYKECHVEFGIHNTSVMNKLQEIKLNKE